MRTWIALAMATSTLACARPSATHEEHASGPPTIASTAVRRTARGVVKAIPPNRGYLSIAHEAIPGYMGAMTMDFEPATPKTFEGIGVGDPLGFTFVATDDGRLVIESVQRGGSTAK